MTETPISFDAGAYLERVGLAQPVEVSEAGLERLHRAQFFSIPFENFDIHLGRRLDLSPAGLFRKLVLNPRGGYCFELNGLFLCALRHFGFDARPILARVHLSGEPTGRTHQLSLVTIGDREWITDVGFGALGLRAPIPLASGPVARQDGIAYRLAGRAPFGTMLQRENEDGWADLYSFDTTHVCPADLKVGNHYTETHPDSSFTQTRVASIPTPTGQRALRGSSLQVLSGDGEHAIELEPGPAYLRALEEHFGIRLDATYESLARAAMRPTALGRETFLDCAGRPRAGKDGPRVPVRRCAIRST